MADLLRQRQQAQAVGDGAAAFTQLFGSRFLRQAVLFNQLVAALGYLDGIQVLALQVFDQRQGCGLFVRYILDDDRHLIQPGQPGGTPAALARNDDVAGAQLFGAYSNGLQQAVFGNAVGQLVQRIVIELLAGLRGVWFDLPQRQGRGSRII